MKLLYLLCISAIVLVGCSSNKIINIEDSNNYVWQQYMNEKEYNELTKGQSYMEVVEIVGGTGELYKEFKDEKKLVYVWNDEILMTQAYELTFVEDQLDSMKIIVRKGTSERTSEEKKPAVPGEN